MLSENLPKNAQRFNCELCDYCTSKKSSFDFHLTTTKHANATQNATKTCQNMPPIFTCICGSEYKHHTSLWRHRKTCTFQKKEKEKEKEEPLITDTSNNNISNEILLEFMKKDSEFKALLMEAFKNGIGNTTHTNSHNTTNKNRFNINVFLNETCKDAMNIMDFVNTMQLQLSDVERVGELGYVKGISNLVINKLKDLDVHKRPIHCSDLKRETMYVKDENVWEKETEHKDKLSKMLTHVAHRNQKQIPVWQKENPEYKDSESVQSEKYLKIIGESMSGLTNDEESSGYTNKIIKNIAKEVVIEKDE
jgi:hypothetical protein